MPRIIEPVIGKFVGPLRMKVPPASGESNDAKDHSRSHPPDTTGILNQSDRRGRYSRNRVNVKKVRSKSLPQSSNSSILLGKPPETDEPLRKRSPKPKIGSKDEHQLETSTSSRAQKKIDSFRMSNGDFSDKDPISNGSAGLEQMSHPLSKRNALAFDTRCVVPNFYEFEKTECVESAFLRHCKDFLRTLDCRHAAPCFLAATRAIGTGSISPENSPASALGIGTEVYNLIKDSNRTIIDKAIDVSDRSIMSGVLVPKLEANGEAIPIPVAIQAKSSWMLFSSLVDTIIVEDSLGSGFVSSNKLHNIRPPLNITILCSDASLFCDTNVESHKYHLQLFLKHITPYLDQGLLSSINIVAAVTGEILLLSGKSDLDEIEGNDNFSQGQVKDTLNLQINHKKAFEKCVRMIECTMVDWEGRCNTPWNVDAPERRGIHVKLNFSCIDNTPIGFMEFTRTLLRDELVANHTRLTCRLRSIELPSIDGTQCSLSFEASYQIFPFSAGSPPARMLSRDMDHLSLLDFQVMKLIPLACIDASLLFGLPMVLRAGLESDYAQFYEMKVLVRCLFHFLQMREQAILLRGFFRDELRTKSAPASRCNGSCFFQSDATSSLSHYFVLMSQEVPNSMSVDGKKSDSGLLFRIAHADFILNESSDPSMNQNGDSSYQLDQEMEAQYMELVENSMTSLDVSAFNPMLDVTLESAQILLHCEGNEEDCVRGKLDRTAPTPQRYCQSMPPSFNPVITPHVNNDTTPTLQPMIVSFYDLSSNNNSDGEIDEMTIS